MYKKITVKNLRTDEVQVLTDLQKYNTETVTGLGPVDYDTNNVIVRGKDGSVDTGGQLTDRPIALIVKLRAGTPSKLDNKVADWKNFILSGDIVELKIESSIREYTIEGRIIKNELREGVGQRSFIFANFNVIINCSDPRFFKDAAVIVALAELSEGDFYAEIDELGDLIEGNSYSEIEDPSGDLIEGNFYSLIIKETISANIFNNGELPAPLIITFSGPSENPSITLTREDLTQVTLKIIKLLSIEESVIIDTDKAQVRLINTLAETDVEAFGLIDGEPDLRSFVLKPKETTIITADSDNESDKNVVVAYKEAYIGIE